MRKIKICFIQSYSYTFFNPNNKSGHGGSERQMFFLAKYLAKDTLFDVSFIVGDFGQDEIETYNKVKVIKGFRTEYEENLFSKVVFAIRYFFLFRRINADVYITSSANMTVGLVTFFCKLFSKKHIHRTAHVVDVNGDYEKGQKIFGAIYRYGIKWADLIITQNIEHQALLIKNYEKQSILFRNVYEMGKSKDSSVIKNRILWASRCEKWKNPEIFLKLVKRFPKYKFEMGLMEANDKEYFQEIIKDAKKLKNLTLYTPIPHNNIEKVFSSAKLFVNTSEYEGFPNTFIEAGISRTPIVSYRVNPDDLFHKYNCGFFADGDINLFFNKIKLLMENMNVWRDCSIGVNEYVKENHNIEEGIIILKSKILNLIQG